VAVDSIQAEIDLHRGTISEGAWLSSKGLIEAPSAPYEYELLNDWYMPGSESYILDFQISSLSKSKRVIAKACIKMFASETVREWTNRRLVIEQSGVAVPKLYSVAGPDYLEEHIPFTLKEVYQNTSDSQKNHLQREFFKTYQSIIELGFTPISLHDVRSRGEDVVLVDFGSDLGGTHHSNKEWGGSTIMTKIETDFQRIIR
jgi:hypothetical protein